MPALSGLAPDPIPLRSMSVTDKFDDGLDDKQYAAETPTMPPPIIKTSVFVIEGFSSLNTDQNDAPALTHPIRRQKAVNMLIY